MTSFALGEVMGERHVVDYHRCRKKKLKFARKREKTAKKPIKMMNKRSEAGRTRVKKYESYITVKLLLNNNTT